MAHNFRIASGFDQNQVVPLTGVSANVIINTEFALSDMQGEMLSYRETPFSTTDATGKVAPSFADKDYRYLPDAFAAALF